MAPGATHVSEVVDKLVIPVSRDNQVLCAIYDVKAAEIHAGRVFLARNAGEAIRMFSDGLNLKVEQPTVIHLHPEDFQLVQLGWVDSGSCGVEPLYRVLIRGNEVKISE